MAPPPARLDIMRQRPADRLAPAEASRAGPAEGAEPAGFLVSRRGKPVIRSWHALARVAVPLGIFTQELMTVHDMYRFRLVPGRTGAGLVCLKQGAVPAISASTRPEDAIEASQAGANEQDAPIGRT
jgi:hypothetical protein